MLKVGPKAYNRFNNSSNIVFLKKVVMEYILLSNNFCNIMLMLMHVFQIKENK